MNKLFFLVVMMVAFTASGQDIKALLKEADNLERSLKEEPAFEKYKLVVAAEPTNILALTRSAELASAIGARKADKKSKAAYYNAALGYADKALQVNSNNAEANYVRALVAGKLTETEPDNKKLVAHTRDIKEYAEKALAIDPNHARATYVLGKWNLEMENLAWVKKAAVKVLYGGLPGSSIDNAIQLFERSRQLDKYFVLTYLDLAKTYKQEDRPAKAIEILNLLVRLPIRTADDAALKEEGKKILSEMQ